MSFQTFKTLDICFVLFFDSNVIQNISHTDPTDLQWHEGEQTITGTIIIKITITITILASTPMVLFIVSVHCCLRHGGF